MTRKQPFLRFPKAITLATKYEPAMAISSQDEADAYFKRCVQHAMLFGLTRADAEKHERANLGYWAGYHSNATRERVERLFRCAHPYFGAIAEKGPPTPEQAFAIGMKIATEQLHDTPDSVARKMRTARNVAQAAARVFGGKETDE